MRGQSYQTVGICLTSSVAWLLCAACPVTIAPRGFQAGSETVGLFPQEECVGGPHVRQCQAGPQGCFCSFSLCHTLEEDSEVTWRPEKCSITATSFCSGGPDLPKEFFLGPPTWLPYQVQGTRLCCPAGSRSMARAFPLPFPLLALRRLKGTPGKGPNTFLQLSAAYHPPSPEPR